MSGQKIPTPIQQMEGLRFLSDCVASHSASRSAAENCCRGHRLARHWAYCRSINLPGDRLGGLPISGYCRSAPAGGNIRLDGCSSPITSLTAPGSLTTCATKCRAFLQRSLTLDLRALEKRAWSRVRPTLLAYQDGIRVGAE